MSYQKFAKDVGTIGITELVIALKGFVILPIITKLLGVENYGIWAQLTVTLSLVTPLATLGLPYALVRFLAAEKNLPKLREGIWSVFAIILAVSGLVGLSFLVFSGPLGLFFGKSKELVWLLAFVSLFECLNQVFYNIFRAFQQMKTYSFFMILQTVGEIAFVAIAIVSGFGITGAVLSLLLIRLIVFGVAGFIVVRKIGFRIPDFSQLKHYLSFSLPTIPGNVSTWVIQSSDRYLIAFFWGTLFVGYYAPAYTIGNALLLFISPLGFVLSAVLSKHYDENKMDEIKTYLRYSLKYFLMLAIPSAFGVSILAKQLLTIFSTPEIASHSQNIVALVAASLILYGTYVIIAQILVIRKKTRIDGAIWVVAALINLALNLTLIPKYGIQGAALSTLIAYAFAFLATLYFSFRYFQFKIEWLFILKSLSSSCLMTLAVWRIDPSGLPATLCAIAAGAAIYIVLIFLLNGFDQKEITALKSFLKKEMPQFV